MGASSVNPTLQSYTKAYTDALSSYSEEKMNQIQVAHREARTKSDKVAMALMRLARWGMDTATGYAEEAKPGSPNTATSWRRRPMDERKWLVRIVFLESIAGVPGMVGGMLRHLHSLRRMKRDNGWYVPPTPRLLTY